MKPFPSPATTSSKVAVPKMKKIEAILGKSKYQMLEDEWACSMDGDC